jgi:excinuclease ABC subunit B
MQKLYTLESHFKPMGDQPDAIAQLVNSRPENVTLLGVTGSGKTFTIANVIAEQENPVLILSPNKTLAAQLYEEFSRFFPHNKVCYFVSYYDYYQPESYLPASDIYIPKETKINQEIDRMRIESVASAINRKDTIIVSSVSCIYSLGNPHDFKNLSFSLFKHQIINQEDIIKKLLKIEYSRNDFEKNLHGTFQVYPYAIEINLPYQKEIARIEYHDGIITHISWIHKETRLEIASLDDILIMPAKYFVTTDEKKENAIKSILSELESYLPTLGNTHYQERLYNRVMNDIELINATGTCPGIENYSPHFEKRLDHDIPPYTIFDFLENPLIIIDESHLAIPQLKGMYIGDQARKKNLVDFGFRLPSSKNNRPLKFTEIEKKLRNVIFVSATPGEYELEHSTKIIEQIIRPTGILDPRIEVQPRLNQLTYLEEQINLYTKKNLRTLITVMTKKLAEDLAEYFEKKKIKVCYLHHAIKTQQRTVILHKLRSGEFDCLIGINLLREGLDLPEVGLVAIMDADIESFLRDKRSLIQTIGRAARNIDGKVILFADKISEPMKQAIEETNRRREIQTEYNTLMGISPTSTTREVDKTITKNIPAQKKKNRIEEHTEEISNPNNPVKIRDINQKIKTLKNTIINYIDQNNFEEAKIVKQELDKLMALLIKIKIKNKKK